MLSNDILAKIQALLNLADNNSSAAEAALAAGRAQALLEKYHLTMADVAAAQEETFQEDAEPLCDVRNGWQPILCDAVTKANQCYGFTSSSGYRIVGKPSNIAIVRYFYTYLEREILRLCKAAVLRGQLDDIDGSTSGEPGIPSDATSRRAYCLGAAGEVGARLRAEREATHARANASGQTAAIVKLDGEAAALKRWAVERYNLRNRAPVRTTAHDAYAAGRAAGRSISLNKGLEGRSGRLLGK
jgi:hypothetical protein